MNTKLKTSIILFFMLYESVISYSCNMYDDPTTCVTTNHLLCAYCVDYSICAEYNPCDHSFVDLNINCNDVIINSSITSYLETCGIMTVSDYCTIIFILLTILCMMYIIIANKYIKNKHEELERPANIIFMTLCIIIILSLIIIFTLYRLTLGNVSKYFDNLYVVLQYLSIIIIALLLIIIIGILLLFTIAHLLHCILSLIKDTSLGRHAEKIKNKLPCYKKVRRSIFDDVYNDEYGNL